MKLKHLAKAIDKIVKANYSSSKSKPKLQEPDPFNGSNPETLHLYPSVQTELPRCPNQFQDNTTKVNYILSIWKVLL